MKTCAVALFAVATADDVAASGFTCESACEFSVGIMKNLINDQGCVAASVEGAAACEAAGLGPEDPLADVCAVIAAEACKHIADHMEDSDEKICHELGVCGGVWSPAWAAETCSLYEIADGSCGQSDLNCDYVKYAKAAEKGLQDGTCADQGYTVATGTQTKTYPVIGDIVITTYSKHFGAKWSCESLCEFGVGTCKKIINTEGCVAAEVEGAAICEAAGGGPEDPITELCAAIAAKACEDIAEHMEEEDKDICERLGYCNGPSVVV